MRYPRPPGNIYSYRASIFGLPLRDALILCAIASVSILTARIEIFLPLIFTVSLPAFLLFRRNGRKNTKHRKKLSLKGRKFSFSLPVSMKNYNDHTYVLAGKYASLFLEVEGLNILAMRVNLQKAVSEGLRNAIEKSGTDMDIYSVHRVLADKRKPALSYLTYIRFSSILTGRHEEEKLTNVSSAAQSFQSAIQILGISVKELREPAEIELLIESLLSRGVIQH